METIKVKKYANAIFQYNIFSVGGIESFIKEVCVKYKDYDIDIFYVKGDEKQIKRLQALIGEDHIHKYNGEIVYCNVAILSWDIGAFINNIFADEVIQFQHSVWTSKSLKIKPSVHDKITKYLAVSDVATKAFKEVTKNKYPVKTCYMPITIDKEDSRRVLTLVSATRLSEEKGKDRMIKLIIELNKNNIPFYYHIFTSNTNVINYPNVVYHKPNLDIRPYIKDADYTVQLSDTESYCYTLVESLCLGTPVICTDLPVLKEIGVVNGKNGFILPFDMKDIPIKEIYEKNLKGFKYTPIKDDLEKYLSKDKTKIVEEELMKVKFVKPVKDMAARVHYVSQWEYGLSKVANDGWAKKPLGTIVDLPKSRAEVVVKGGYAVYVDKEPTFVDEIKALKPKAKTRKNIKKVN
ncbi:MAG: glycosyltransferase [Bacteroidales bacterium]|nr:glycosyltransferase [Candidatus Scybalousia scybalohippi]